MKRTFFACILMLGSGLAAKAQAIISGQIINASKKPVAAATVSLLFTKDSSINKTLISNELGNFAFKQVT